MAAAERPIQIKLHIPSRRDPRPGAFDTRPRKVEQWLAALPLANVGETTRRVYHGLTEINGLHMDAQERYKVMEMFRPVVHDVSVALKKHFVGQPFPLPEKNRRVAELSREVLAQMATGYKIIVADLLSGVTRFDVKTAATAIHRAMSCLGQMLLKSYQIYGPPPAGVWREIHQLYLYAELKDLHQKPQIRDAEYAHIEAGSIRDLYKQILLLAVACPYRLRQGEAERIYAALERWAPLCMLHRLEGSRAHDLFVVVTDSDDAPSYLALNKHQGSPYCRSLDTSGLAHTIREEMAHTRETTTAQELLQQGILTQDILRRLMLAWGVMPKRSFSRTTKFSTVRVTMGLSAIHHFLGGEAAFSPDAGGDTPGRGPTRAETGIFASRAQFTSTPLTKEIGHTPDVWDMIYPNLNAVTAVPARPAGAQKTTGLPAAQYSFQIWKMVNVSAAGVCLLWDSEDASKARVGELVGVMETDGDASHWSVGVIRWMKYVRGHGLELGVQMLAPNAVPVTLRTCLPKGQYSEYLRAVMLPEIPAVEQPATLLMPAIASRVDDTVLINLHGKEMRARLTKVLENTGSFAQIQFSPLSPQDKKTGDSGRRNDFDALWSSL